MRRLGVIVAVVSLMVLACGCTSTLQDKLQKAQDSTYAANVIFGQIADDLQKLCDDGWNSKLDRLDNDIDVEFMRKLKAASKDWTDDGKGTVKTGTVDVTLLFTLQTKQAADHAVVSEARKKYQADRARIVAAIEAYKANNELLHQKQTDAYEALKSAQALINKGLTALGVVAGAAAGAGTAAAF